MVIWNLLDGEPSHSRPLLVPFKSMWGGTPGTNPRQQPLSARQVIWIFLVCNKFVEYSIQEPSTLAQNH
jgi:hypothetical protein